MESRQISYKDFLSSQTTILGIKKGGKRNVAEEVQGMYNLIKYLYSYITCVCTLFLHVLCTYVNCVCVTMG